MSAEESVPTEAGAAETRLQRPGFGLELDKMPTKRFPHAIADFSAFATTGVTLREQRMLNFVNQITDKPRWWEKVKDKAIVARWRDEACGSQHQQWYSDKHLDKKCFQYCLRELRDKAKYVQEHNLVHVLDVNATIVKSDLESSDDFWSALRVAVRPLEGVPDRLKDWHPRSDGLVLDLLHPSLFPLKYGVSRVLPHETVPLNDCATYIGQGEVCQIPNALVSAKTLSMGFTAMSMDDLELMPWGSFQWLPSELAFKGDGHRVQITSYINNLHPRVHQELYSIMEMAVERAIPLWNECLSFFHDRTRIQVASCGYNDFVRDGYPGDDADEDDDSDDSDAEWQRDEDFKDWLASNPESLIKQPSVKEKYVPIRKRRVNLRQDFPSGLQVIFKLASIHLTPEKPSYYGSNWHIEGALNEHICATALFYYDSHNISDNCLEFQQHVDVEAMVEKAEQYEYTAAERLYGIANYEASVQQLGKVLTREGRWIAFSNVMQHRVAPFALLDKTKEGHRKILAMFLVDPYIKILSTANVPPQRRDWWAEEVRKIRPFTDLPSELFDHIIKQLQIDDFPIQWDKACEMREELMAERGRITDEYDNVVAKDHFNFCEH